MTYKTLLTHTEAGVGLITLNRPEALNALNDKLTRELSHAIDAMEARAEVSAIVLTGSDRAFAAGADIKEIRDKTFVDVYCEQFITASWERIASARKPTIAAVSGHVVGNLFSMYNPKITNKKSKRTSFPST